MPRMMAWAALAWCRGLTEILQRRLRHAAEGFRDRALVGGFIGLEPFARDQKLNHRRWHLGEHAALGHAPSPVALPAGGWGWRALPVVAAAQLGRRRLRRRALRAVKHGAFSFPGKVGRLDREYLIHDFFEGGLGLRQGRRFLTQYDAQALFDLGSVHVSARFVLDRRLFENPVS